MMKQIKLFKLTHFDTTVVSIMISKQENEHITNI